MFVGATAFSPPPPSSRAPPSRAQPPFVVFGRVPPTSRVARSRSPPPHLGLEEGLRESLGAGGRGSGGEDLLDLARGEARAELGELALVLAEEVPEHEPRAARGGGPAARGLAHRFRVRGAKRGTLRLSRAMAAGGEDIKAVPSAGAGAAPAAAAATGGGGRAGVAVRGGNGA